MPRYQSTITGKFVSRYYAVRHPATTVEIPATSREDKMQGRLQSTEIPLYSRSESGAETVRGRVTVEPGGKPFRSEIQLQFNVCGLQLYRLPPEEAHTIGSSLVAHGLECGYDPDAGKTAEITD